MEKRYTSEHVETWRREGAVVVLLGLGQLQPDPDPVERLRAVLPDLVALADTHGGEDPLGRVLDAQQVVHEGAVAVLEDPQRDGDPGEQHRVQGEHRQRRGHVDDPRGCPGCPPGHRGFGRAMARS